MIFGLYALIVASFFTGAAIYINFVEQPARLKLTDASLLTEWKTSYKRGFAMQASLVIISGILGLIAFASTWKWFYLFGSILILSNWPYTFFVIMKTNKKLMETSLDAANSETRKLIKCWGWLHAVRSLLGLCSTLIFLASLTSFCL